MIPLFNLVLVTKEEIHAVDLEVKRLEISLQKKDTEIVYLRNTQKLFLSYQLFESLITFHTIIKHTYNFNFLKARFYTNLNNGIRIAQLVAFLRFITIIQSDHKIEPHLKVVVFSKFFNIFPVI